MNLEWRKEICGYGLYIKRTPYKRACVIPTQPGAHNGRARWVVATIANSANVHARTLAEAKAIAETSARV